MRAKPTIGAVLVGLSLLGGIGRFAPAAHADARLDALVAKLTSKHAKERAEAAKDLRELGDRARPAAAKLAALLGDDDRRAWEEPVPPSYRGPNPDAPPPPDPGDPDAPAPPVEPPVAPPVPVPSGAVLAGEILAGLGDAGLLELRRALRSTDPAQVARAADAISGLGDRGAPAVPDLLAALDTVFGPYPNYRRPLPGEIWSRRVRPAVLGALASIGPAARDALVPLRERFASGEADVFGALLRIAPEDPAPLDHVLAAVDARHLRLHHEAALAALEPWLAKLGASALPLLDRIADESPAALDRLVALGEPAYGALVRRLAADANGWMRFEDVVTAMTRAGCVPPRAVPLVADFYRRGLDAGADRFCVAWLAIAGDAGEAATYGVLRASDWNSGDWSRVHEHAPEFVERLSRRWLRDRLPPEAAPASADKLVGGRGGAAFETSGGGPMIGLQVGIGHLNWHTIVRSVAALHRTAEGDVAAGTTRGGRGVKTQRIVARDGYEMAGLLVAGGSRVHGVAVVFARVTDAGRLDLSDAYVSQWLGRLGDGPAPVLLGADGRRISGLRGRAGNDLDALGIVVAE